MADTTNFFDTVLVPKLSVEGGYVNNPDDRGGETNWGMTEAVAREEGYTGSMRAMLKPQALDIYKRRFFIKPGFDKVAELSQAIAAELFDTGINMGPGVPSKWLQQLLNGLNRKGTDYPDISVDGAIGPGTLGALKAYLRVRGSTGEKVFLVGLNCLQGARYIELAEGREQNETFLYGWLQQRVEL